MSRYNKGILILLVLCSLALGTTKVFESDTFWHIKLGQEILKNLSLPVTVPFTFTGEDVPWVATEWLSEVVFFILYSVGGFSGLTLLNAIVLALCALLIYGSLRAHNCNTTLSFIISLLWAVMSRDWFVERPHIFSILCMCFYLFYLSRHKNIFVLPLVMVLWANLHGGFILGLIFLGCALTEQAYEVYSGHSRGIAALRKLEWAFILTCAATFFTPYHVRLLPFIIRHSWTAKALDITVEFRPVSPAGYYIALLIAFLLIALYLRRKKEGLISTCVFGALAISSQRIVPFFLIVTTIVVGEIIMTLLKAVPQRIEKPLKKFPSLPLLLSVLLAFALVPFALSRKGFPSFGLGRDNLFYPAGAMEFIQKSGIKGNGYNSMNFAGELILSWYPERKVFHGSFFSENEIHRREGKPFNEVVNKYNVTHAILEARLKYLETGIFLSKEWALVYWDDTALVMVKRIPENFRVIKENEFLIINPDILLSQVERDDVPSSALKELEREAYQVPNCALGRLALATLYTNLKKNREAEREFLKVIDLPPNWSYKGAYFQENPYHILAYNSLGVMFSKQLRLKEAEESFYRAIRAGPLFYEAYYNLGLLYASQGKLDKAEKSIKKSLDIEPSYSWAWNNLGVILRKKGDITGAMKAFSMALVSDPFNKEAKNNRDELLRRSPIKSGNGNISE